ncbi:MAG: sigma-70 family RNA polymerase sigma factor [Alphaproteobacteria bacterium]|nr:sigma-70 family RNA polymerase sigma factor [Alphaproteobacteria bacterium]
MNATPPNEFIAHNPDDALRHMDPAVEAALTQNNRAFLQFLVRRLGNPEDAKDVFQNFCLRVVNASDTIRQTESLVAWLYSVLRSVLTDHYRSEAARRRREGRYARELDLLTPSAHEIDTELEEAICGCFYGLLPALRSEYAEVLRRIDLQGQSREQVARELDLSAANVRVRLHRARQALRKSLGGSCGSCCKHGFRECTCAGATATQ